jgi:hypothetical protein
MYISYYNTSKYIEQSIILVSTMPPSRSPRHTPCQLPLEGRSRVLHHRAPRPLLTLRRTGRVGGEAAGVTLVVRDRGRGDDLVPCWNGQAVLPPHLARAAAGRPADLGAEGIDLVDDEALHAVDGVFFLEREVKLLLGLVISTIVCNRKVYAWKRTVSQIGSSAGSCQTARYGWFNASSHEMRFAGSKHNI